jgi:hypothetical protein
VFNTNPVARASSGGYAVSEPYQVLSPTPPVPAPDDVLEMIVREGARKMLQSALEKEVDDFLGRHRYQRTEEHRDCWVDQPLLAFTPTDPGMPR